jgi:hypothetical protein
MWGYSITMDPRNAVEGSPKSITFDPLNVLGRAPGERPFLEEERKTSAHAECFSV